MTPHVPQKKGRFRKEELVLELMALGHRRITAPIARLVADEVDDKLKKRKVSHPSPEVMGDLVAAALQDLGLVRQVQEPEHENFLPEDDTGMPTAVLESMARAVSDRAPGEGLPHALPLNFSESALGFIETNLCRKDDEGRPTETPEELLGRIARLLARTETRYQPQLATESLEVEFFNLMASEAFLPDLTLLRLLGEAGPVASRHVGFVVPDSVNNFFDTLKVLAALHTQGIAAGVSLSQVSSRKKNSLSGPLALTRFADAILLALQSGQSAARDRYYLCIDHPGVLEWLSLAHDPSFAGRLSLGLTTRFILAVETDGYLEQIDPVTRRTVKSLRARPVFKKILECLTATTGPDLVFVDTAQEANLTPREGGLEVPNATGDQFLQAGEPLTAGFINLYHFVNDEGLDWEALRTGVEKSIHFLENAVEMQMSSQAEDANLCHRKLALGVMGWAEVLAHLNILYDSEKARSLATQVMTFIQAEASRESIALASRRGIFSHFDKTPLADQGINRRHAMLTALTECRAEAGLLGVTPGIAPFSFKDLQAGSLPHHLFKDWLEERGLESWLGLVTQKNDVDELKDLPEEIRRTWIQAPHAEAMLAMIEAFGTACEGAVSATIPVGTSVEEAGSLILKAFKMKLKSMQFVYEKSTQPVVAPPPTPPAPTPEPEPEPEPEMLKDEAPLTPPSRNPSALFSGADYFSIEEGGNAYCCPICSGLLDSKNGERICPTCGPV